MKSKSIPPTSLQSSKNYNGNKYHQKKKKKKNFDYGQKQIVVALQNLPKVRAHITINHRLRSNSAVGTFQQWEGGRAGPSWRHKFGGAAPSHLSTFL